MARGRDAGGYPGDGTYLDPEGMQALIKQLHGVVRRLDEMTDAHGKYATAGPYGRDGRLTGAGYLVSRNTDTLRDTRRAVLKLLGMYRELLTGAARMVDTHVEGDDTARRYIDVSGS